MEKLAVVHRDFDRVDQIPELVFRVLNMLNFLILLFVTLTTQHALWGYVHEGTALEFLLRAGYVPPIAWKYPVITSQGAVKAGGAFVDAPGAQPDLSDYSCVIYNGLSDPDNRADIY